MQAPLSRASRCSRLTAIFVLALTLAGSALLGTGCGDDASGGGDGDGDGGSNGSGGSGSSDDASGSGGSSSSDDASGSGASGSGSDAGPSSGSNGSPTSSSGSPTSSTSSGTPSVTASSGGSSDYSCFIQGDGCQCDTEFTYDLPDCGSGWTCCVLFADEWNSCLCGNDQQACDEIRSNDPGATAVASCPP